jgi:hypothetical protein
MKCLPNYKTDKNKEEREIEEKEKKNTESAMKSKNKNVKCVEAKRKMSLKRYCDEKLKG